MRPDANTARPTPGTHSHPETPWLLHLAAYRACSTSHHAYATPIIHEEASTNQTELRHGVHNAMMSTLEIGTSGDFMAFIIFF